MYHAIVRSKVRDSFRALSQGDSGPALALMAPDCQYRFVGAHALGGHRSHRGLIDQWFQRFLRILPGFQFRAEEVLVEGWPWRTRVVVRLAVEWAAPDGSRYRNVAIQMVTLRWFRAVDILTVDDSQGFSALLDRLAKDYGTLEAAAAPIEG